MMPLRHFSRHAAADIIAIFMLIIAFDFDFRRSLSLPLFVITLIMRAAAALPKG